MSDLNEAFNVLPSRKDLRCASMAVAGVGGRGGGGQGPRCSCIKIDGRSRSRDRHAKVGIPIGGGLIPRAMKNRWRPPFIRAGSFEVSAGEKTHVFTKSVDCSTRALCSFIHRFPPGIPMNVECRRAVAAPRKPRPGLW